jgi:hypothetical protein
MRVRSRYDAAGAGGGGAAAGGGRARGRRGRRCIVYAGRHARIVSYRSGPPRRALRARRRQSSRDMMIAVLSLALTGVTTVVSVASPSAPLGSAITMQPCTDPANQEFICYVDSKFPTCGGPAHPSPYAGMHQFKSHAGLCLAADPVTHLMTTAPCNISDGYQRFNYYSGFLLQGAHQNKTCITANNCTIHSSKNVSCTPGATLRMEPCINQWPGSPIPGTPDPAQIWDPRTDHVGGGSIVLKYTWVAADHPKHGPQVNSTSCLSWSPKV